MNKVIITGALSTLLVLLGATCMEVKTAHNETKYPQKMVVIVPVADLRSRPEAVACDVKLPTTSKTNGGLESQLLFGEHILTLEEQGEWIRIQALEQAKFKDDKWQGYPGWIKKSQAIQVTEFPKYNLVVNQPWAELIDDHQSIMLSMGTKLRGIQHVKNYWEVELADGTTAKIAQADVYHMTKEVTEDIDTLRKEAIALADTLVGKLYSWGGRSFQDLVNHQISSTDCSGTTNIYLRVLGFQIPRDAHEQYLTSAKIDAGTKLKPGDLIFFSSKERKSRMNHVMTYLGNGQLHETTGASMNTRIITVEERIGKSLDELRSEDAFSAGGYEGHVYFGTYFGSREQLQALRDAELRNVYE